MIKIDLDNTYDLVSVNKSLTEFIFVTEQVDTNLIVRFDQLKESFLPRVYNLAFGQISGKGEIDDHIILRHKNINKVFSTIILIILTFLENYKNCSVGIDGSDERRAYLYHRMFKSNYETLKEYLIMIGVDWYVKLLRNGSVEMDELGEPNFKPRPEPFDLKRGNGELYRYYLVTLNHD